jgi:3D (Asp-Asp-Asp) domain-containing protein
MRRVVTSVLLAVSLTMGMPLEAGQDQGLTQAQVRRLLPENPSRGTSIRTMMVEATAYTWTGNRTATGTWPEVGTIAVDPEVIPLGTRLYVEGYGWGVAADTGGLIKGRIIDVYFDTHRECIEWGRRQVEVRLEG